MRETLLVVLMVVMGIFASIGGNFAVSRTITKSPEKEILKLELDKAKLQAIYSEENHRLLKVLAEGGSGSEASVRAAKLQMEKDVVDLKIAEVKAR